MNKNETSPARFDTQIEEPEGLAPDVNLVNAAEGTTTSLVAALRTHTGLVRDVNEDSCLLWISSSGGQEPLLPFGLFLVADGMGGHEGGERASRIASRTAAQHLFQELYLPLFSDVSHPGREHVRRVMQAAVLAAHGAVHPGDYEGNGGTTLTVALVLGGGLYLAHVGDSRAYWLVDGELQALTQDHSLVQRLQDAGKLTPEEAQNYQYRHVLLRALGQAEALEVDVDHLLLPPRGKLLLCSDGLCGYVSDQEMRQLMEQSVPPAAIAERLLALALAAGGQDNVSLIVVEFGA